MTYTDKLSSRLGGLYAITPDLEDTAALLGKTEAVLANGARLLQYRNKTAPAATRAAQAVALAALCRRYHVPLIINDHLGLALEVDAEGLHIGAEDGSIAEARARLGHGKLLGVSCYRSMDTAMEAARLGASYVAFGGFFPSSVKPSAGAERTPVALLAQARRVLALPIFAIGGITPVNARDLVAAGADGVAVITALFAPPDPGAAARAFAELFA